MGMGAYRGGARALTGGRRRVFGAAGVAGAALVGAALPAVGWGAAPAGAAGDPLPLPKPIPGGLRLDDGRQIHVFGPGPGNITLPYSGATLGGLDVENSVLTDFKGSSALAYLVGKATGHDGTKYNLETDLRAFEGEYVAANGRRRQGTFALV
jgi:hypothetical protein